MLNLNFLFRPEVKVGLATFLFEKCYIFHILYEGGGGGGFLTVWGILIFVMCGEGINANTNFYKNISNERVRGPGCQRSEGRGGGGPG